MPHLGGFTGVRIFQSFAAALAMKENAAVITGDPEMRDLANLITVEWIDPGAAGPTEKN
jgi:hypothetical protein